jgi:ferredoxin-NADP reductase
VGGAARDAASGLAETVRSLVTDVTGLVAYVCGSEAMIHRVRDVLVAKGLDRKSVKWEKFW